MKKSLFACLAVSASLCWADANQIRQLFQSILSDPPDTSLPTSAKFHSALTEVSESALPAVEVGGLLPLAKQCLGSSNVEVRRAGMLLFLAVALRLDSSKLLEPYIEDLDTVASDPASPFRTGALAILALTTSKPRVSPKAVATLAAHLDDSSFSSDEVATVIGSLLETSPSDPATVHRVLGVVEKRSDVALTDSVLRTLGLLRIQNAEAISFIGQGLNSGNPYTREAAVDAVSRLDRNIRTRFAAHLGRIAADHTERQHVRSQAAEALR